MTGVPVEALAAEPAGTVDDEANPSAARVEEDRTTLGDTVEGDAMDTDAVAVAIEAEAEAVAAVEVVAAVELVAVEVTVFPRGLRLAFFDEACAAS